MLDLGRFDLFSHRFCGSGGRLHTSSRDLHVQHVVLARQAYRPTLYPRKFRFFRPAFLFFSFFFSLEVRLDTHSCFFSPAVNSVSRSEVPDPVICFLSKVGGAYTASQKHWGCQLSCQLPGCKLSVLSTKYLSIFLTNVGRPAYRAQSESFCHELEISTPFVKA